MVVGAFSPAALPVTAEESDTARGELALGDAEAVGMAEYPEEGDIH